ncbi:MAG: NUDIX domain-containing protein [Candidatus Marinimicrobia bacterium]|nr:NUDIX domain-containing protein [Candidatus Neomarinimicrobiota bacterium]
MKTAKRPRVVLTNRAIVLDEKGEILLIKRANTDSWRPGFWEFPGGKLDEGQDLSHALEREILEETGLVVIPINRVVYYESQISQMKKYRGLPYIVLIGLAKKIGGKIKLSEEHTESAWVTPQKALNCDLTSESKKALLVLRETFPKLKIDF